MKTQWKRLFLGAALVVTGQFISGDLLAGCDQVPFYKKVACYACRVRCMVTGETYAYCDASCGAQLSRQPMSIDSILALYQSSKK